MTTITVSLPDDREVTVEVELGWVRDGKYGADADGNRGMAVSYLDEVVFDDPTHDDDGNPLTKEEVSTVIDLVNEKAADMEPEEDDYDEDTVGGRER